MPAEDQREFLESLDLDEPASHRFIRSAYALLDLISMLTAGEDECRAWPVRRNLRAPMAAGKIHSDIERGFIRAEVILWEDLVTLGSEAKCRDTGGLLAKRLTDVPGSSAYFSRGIVTYSNEAKEALLGVSSEMLAEHGAVSEPVAGAMASACRDTARSDFAMAVTGIAGPDGGNPPQKPVGLVYIALASADGVEARAFRFGEHLTRDEVRDRACKTALNMLRLALSREEDA